MKHQSYIRSLFVAFCAFFVCASAIAETYLNPFAYRLDNMAEKNGATLSDAYYTINYSLSGPATSVVIRLWDITGDDDKSKWSRSNGNTVNTGTCIQAFVLTGDYLEKGAHTYNIDFTDLIGQDTKLHQKKVRWTIDVKGGNQSEEFTPTTITTNEVTGLTINGSAKDDWKSDVVVKTRKDRTFNYVNAQQVTQEWYIDYPGGVDVNTNPYDLNFGVVLCTSSRDIEDNTKYFTGGGVLHAFGGGMEHLKTKWDDGKKEANGMGGGFSWGLADEDFSSSKVGLGPHRVRFAEDGRVFLTASLNANKILYQVTKPSNVDGNNFYETWTGAKFQSVFTAGAWDPNTATLKSGGNFIAGPNSAFDVRGEGANLKLLLLSHNKAGATSPSKESFRVDEYNLSAQAPATTNLLGDNAVTKKVHTTADAMIVGYDNLGIEYDPYGGFWIAQLRLSPAGPLAATLVHRTKNGTYEKEEHAVNRGKGAVRHNDDFTQLAVAGGYIQDTIMHKFNSYGSALHDNYYNKKEVSVNGRAFKTHTVKENQITIYKVSYESSTGAAKFTDSMYINTGNLRAVKDIAWDFADNLYVVNRNIGDPGKDKKILTAFALPHKDKEVSTPCQPKYHFSLAPIYNVTVAFNPATSNDYYGYVKQTNRTNAYTANGKPYAQYLHNATIELTAVDIPEGCKFYQWTNTNNNAAEISGNVLTLTNLSKAANITANVGLCVYEDTKILGMTSQTTFPAAFVQRELDDVSYSTICLPFNLTTLIGTPYEGASVLKLELETPSNVDGNRIFLNFEETTSIEAGKPYLIQLPKGKKLQAEEIFTGVTCPVLSGTNDYGGLDVDCGNGIIFHGIMNPSEIPVDENTLFLTADNRLVTLYGQNSVNINGLRGYFTVSGDMAKTAEFVLNLPEKVTTSIPMVNIADSLKVTKYLWNGQIYIQRGNEVYDLSGARVK